MLATTTLESQALATPSKKNTLHVRLDSKGQAPFSKAAPVDILYATIAPILGQLVYTSNSYDLEPGLLESFNWDYENEAYVLKVRNGLKFHNGRKVTSKDLEFSILRGFYSGRPSFFVAFLNNIEGVEAIKGDKKFVSGKVKGIKILDDQTLRVKLKKPNPSFLHSLARSYFSIVPIEALNDDYETWKSVPIGAGSYKVKSFDPNLQTMTLEKMGNIPSPKELVFHYGNDSHPTDIDISSLGKEKEVAVSKRAASLTSIYFNFNNPVAADEKFRQAINIALDRNKIADGIKIYSPAHEFLAQHFWGRLKTKTARDLVAAKKLLKNVSSLDLTKEYEIPVFNGSLGDKKYGAYAKELERQLAEVGLKVKLVDSTVKFFPQDNKTTLFRLASLGADVADPLVLFGLLQGEKSPMRPHFPLDDKKYEKLLHKAQISTTLDQRVIAVKNLSQYLHDNTWLVPLFEKKLLVSINTKRINDVGTQDGGLTFFLERTRLN